jgi:Flp pilus assembly protein TadB
MGRRRGQGPQQQIKGFRPGKEPPGLRKAHAKKQFGDLNRAQERMVELFAERSPEESRKLISRWTTGAFGAGVVLSVLTVLAWTWTWIAGAIVGVLAGLVFFLYFRLRAQRTQFEEMADAVAQATGRKR